MFTGLISDVGEIVHIDDVQGANLRRLRIHSAYAAQTLVMGASIACSGPCLTVVGFGARDQGSWFEVDAAAETLARTTVGRWTTGQRVNLERSLKIGDELGGHLVTGHIDGTAEVVDREEVASTDPWGATARFSIKAPETLAKFIAVKGSICLDGTSLTVNSVMGATLSVLLIPHSLAVTTWGHIKAGDQMNLEVDLMARYAARLTEADAEISLSAAAQHRP